MITSYIEEFKPLCIPFDYSFLPCREYVPLLEIEQPTLRILQEPCPVYREIAFFQESDANEFIDLLNNDGETAVIDCLTNYYDYGDGALHKVEPWGTNDRIFRDDQYVLAVNFYIPYISLYSVE